MSDYFNVHFIDLPGFIQDLPPLSAISIESYAEYVQESYLLGGISFGFLVVSYLPPDQKCKGLVAIAPYINARWLKLSFWKKPVYSSLTNMTLSLQLSAKVWQSRLFHRVFHWYSDYPTERINTLLSHMDGRTFFETAKIILSHRQPCPFQRLPYALILSETDKTVKNDRLLKLFGLFPQPLPGRGY